MKQTFKENATWIVIALIVIGIFSYSHWYLPWHHLQLGYVDVKGFNCPKDHPIKAHIGDTANIYHIPGSTYYDRTSASNGHCFDTATNARKQGFRAPYN